MKKQMKFEKIVCLATIIVAAVAFIFALGLCTDLYSFEEIKDDIVKFAKNLETLQKLIDKGIDPATVHSSLAGYQIDNYYLTTLEIVRINEYIQSYAQSLINMSIFLIVISTLLFITKTNTRRKYYVSNYVATAIVAIAFLAVSVWAIINTSYWIGYLGLFDQSQVDRLLADSAYLYYVRNSGAAYAINASPKFLYFSIATNVMTIIMSVLLVVNLIWKTMYMKYENKVLSGEVTVDEE